MATTKKNSTTVDEHNVVEEAEATVSDLQVAGEARFNEIRDTVSSRVADIDTARQEIVALVRPIREESLWVYGRNAAGEQFTNWKDAVKDVLNGAFSHWSKQAKSGIVLMLIDEGFTVADAAEVTEQTPGEAKKAVAEADAEAQGAQTAPPVEVTPAQKAAKIADQTIAQNKRCADALYDMPLDSLRKLAIDVRGLATQVEQLLKDRIAEQAGTAAA